MNSDGAFHLSHPHNGHMIREPGPGDLSYRGMGYWQVLPIPRAWRTALEIAVASAPGLCGNTGIMDLMSADVIETDGSITPNESNHNR
jgi:hypothetical protein